jgi:hypothetical protein
MVHSDQTSPDYYPQLLAKLGMERRTQAAVFVSKLDRTDRPPSINLPKDRSSSLAMRRWSRG